MPGPIDLFAAMLDAAAEGDAATLSALREVAADAEGAPVEGLGDPAGESADRVRAYMAEALGRGLTEGVLVEAGFTGSREVMVRGKRQTWHYRDGKRVASPQQPAAKQRGAGKGTQPQRPAAAKKLSARQVGDAIDRFVAARKADPRKNLDDAGKRQAAAAIAALGPGEIEALRKRHGLPPGEGDAQAQAAELVAKLTARQAPAAPQQKAATKAAAAKPAGLPPLRKAAGATLSYQDEEAAKVAMDLFGDADVEVVAAAVCAPPGARVRVDRSGTSGAEVTVEHEGVTATRLFSRDRKGRLVVNNDYFEIAEGSPHKGAGYLVFANQIQALRALGVREIRTVASGSAGDPDYNGYYTWPRLGYSGKMSGKQMGGLPEELEEATDYSDDVLDLMRAPGGARWWKENGSTIHCTFDLADGSKNMKALEAYVRERQTRDAGGKKAD